METIESKDMITFVNRIIEKSNHFNTVIRVPERCNGNFIDVKDLHEDNIPSISHKNNYDYQIIISLQRYTVHQKTNSGYRMVKKYRVRFNGRLESHLTLEEFTELYTSIIGKYKEMKEDNELYYENTDLSIFNSIVK